MEAEINNRPVQFEVRKKIRLYLMTHSTHFINLLWLYGITHMVKDNPDSERGRKEIALFNDTLNAFYLRLYGVGHMVKDRSDSERKPAATTTWTTFFH